VTDPYATPRPGDPRADAPAPRRRRSVTGYVLVAAADVAVLLAIALVLGLALLAGRTLQAPAWLETRIEGRLVEALAPAEVEIGQISLGFDWIGPVDVQVSDIALAAPTGAALARVPRLSVRLDRTGLWRGDLGISQVTVDGAELRVRRGRDGSLELGFAALGPEAVAEGTTGVAPPRDLALMLDEVFARPGLDQVSRVEARALTLDVADERAGRAWRIDDGVLTLERSAEAFEAALRVVLKATADASPATAALRVRLARDGSGAEIAAQLEDVPAADIAIQAPQLGWLAPLDAPVSGALIGRLDPSGQLWPVDGTLDIAAGAVRRGGRGSPAPFDRSRTYFNWRPAPGVLTFDTIGVEAPALSARATGRVLLEGAEIGLPEAYVAQVAIEALTVDAGDRFSAPISFDAGHMDVRLHPSPFRAEIGQAALLRSGAEGAPLVLYLSGDVVAEDGGPHLALNATAPALTPADVLSLWPYDGVPLTRDWVARNLLDGTLRDVSAAVRTRPGGPPNVSVGFAFEQALVKALPTLPPIEDGAGFASIHDHAFTLTLEEGEMAAPLGGMVDVSGSLFRVLDLRLQPPDAEVRLDIAGPLPSVLSLIDLPPFRLLEKSGRTPDLAEGVAQASGTLRFPLAPRVTPEEVGFDIKGEVRSLVSNTLVPGRNLTADWVALRADPTLLTLEGPVEVNGVPIPAVWRQELGADAAPPEVSGTLPLSPDAADALGIGLPAGLLGGSGRAQGVLTLPRGEAPSFRLSSDLAGVSLRVPALGWAMSRGQTGALELAGRLGAPPRIDRLTLEAPGLRAEGALTFVPDGGLERAVFSRVRAGNWLDAAVTLRGRGAGRAPAVAISSGRADLRGLPRGDGGGGGAPMTLALDRLTVTPTLALTGLRAELTGAGTGTFRGEVNGATPVTGELRPSAQGRPALRIASADAGGVLRAADFFERARGGALRLDLVPRAQQGHYTGALRIEDVRVQDASALGAILNTISVVGLVDQLNGAGLQFREVEAEFVLTPNAVQVTRSSATGPSLGITVEGLYDMARKQIDVQGVLSPAYAFNAIGQLFGTRRGEGLVGLTYTMRGAADAPQIAVNPLSALTPGMFREIFRAPPPRLERQ